MFYQFEEYSHLTVQEKLEILFREDLRLNTERRFPTVPEPPVDMTHIRGFENLKNQDIAEKSKVNKIK